MKRAIETYKREPIARFFFWLSAFFLSMLIFFVVNYYVQIKVPQQVPDFATTEGVVTEASKRFASLKWSITSIEVYPNSVENSEPAHVGLAGYFVPEKNFGNISDQGATYEAWGKDCQVEDFDDIYYSDGRLIVFVVTSDSDPKSVQVCENNMPASVTAYEVTVTQHADERLYYLFKKVILPVEYVLVVD